MTAVGLIVLLVFLGGVSSFSWRTYANAKAAGGLPLPRGTPGRVRETAGVLRRQVAADYPGLPHVARKIRTAIPGRKPAGPGNGQPATPPKQPRPSPFQRLLVPRGSAARSRLPRGKDAPVTTGTAAPDTPSIAPPGQPAPTIPSPSGNGSGPSETTPTGGNMPAPSGGGGAAGDLMAAAQRVTAEAQAGGIRHKVRAGLVLGEGLGQQASVLEQHAQNMAETGQYPPAAWEPWQQAAQMVRAGAAKLAESANVIAGISKTPVGEIGERAPARPEIVKSAQ